MGYEVGSFETSAVEDTGCVLDPEESNEDELFPLRRPGETAIRATYAADDPEAEPFTDAERSAEKRKPHHVITRLDAVARRLYIGAAEETYVKLDISGRDHTDYSPHRAEMFKALVRNQQHEQPMTAEQLWKSAFGTRKFDRDIIEQFRAWCKRATYHGRPLVSHDKDKDAFRIEDFDISLKYTNTTSSGSRKPCFIFPSGCYCEAENTTRVASMLMATLETGGWVAATSLQDIYSGKVKPHSLQQMVYQAVTSTKRALPPEYKLERHSQLEQQQRMYGPRRRFTYYRVVCTEPAGDDLFSAADDPVRGE